jgi:hypothetical protein
MITNAAYNDPSVIGPALLWPHTPYRAILFVNRVEGSFKKVVNVWGLLMRLVSMLISFFLAPTLWHRDKERHLLARIGDRQTFQPALISKSPVT